jgi:hypothetical protein
MFAAAFFVATLLPSNVSFDPLELPNLSWGTTILELTSNSNGEIVPVDLPLPLEVQTLGLVYKARNTSGPFELAFLFTPLSDRLAAVAIYP